MKKLLFLLLLITNPVFAQLAPPEISKSSPEYQQNEKILFFGFWHDIPRDEWPHTNVSKVFIDEVPDLPEDVSFIPFIGNFHPDDSSEKWKERLRYKGDVLKDIDAARVPFVILHDEPYPKGFTREQLEELIDLAREVIGDQFRYTFSFTRTTIEVEEREIPRNIKVVGINFYPFYYRSCLWCERIHSEEDFSEFFGDIMELARDKSPEGVEFFITGQSFFNEDKWRKPHADAPFWYVDFIKANPDIRTLLWFEYQNNRKWTGAEDMPEFLENMKRVFEEL